MDHHRNRLGILVLLLAVRSVCGGSPSTQRVPVDPLARLESVVAAKAGGQSVALILRPDSASFSAESPAAVAAIRDLLLQKLGDAKVNLSTSDPADELLRNASVAGPLPVAMTPAAITAAKTDLLLYGAMHRAGDQHKIAFTLLDAHHPLTQVSVTLNRSDFTSNGDDIELANTAITTAVESAAGKMIDPLQSAQIKTVLLTVRADSEGQAATAGFELALYDSAARVLQQNNVEAQTLHQSIGRGALMPATVVKLKDLPADAAVMVATYTRKPAGTLVKLSLVSTKSDLASEAVGLDSWDVAAMPSLPVLNVGVLAYSEAQQGKKVGNGECWTLAAEALISAKARRADGYTFGRKLAKGETILAGDIFQFTSAKFEGHSGNSTWWVTLGNPHHTAVVRRVLGPTKFEILEQNPGPVKTATIDFKDLKSGEWEAWRAVAK